jgi:hypothetical protein
MGHCTIRRMDRPRQLRPPRYRCRPCCLAGLSPLRGTCARAHGRRTHTIPSVPSHKTDVVRIAKAVSSVLLDLPKLDDLISLIGAEQEITIVLAVGIREALRGHGRLYGRRGARRAIGKRRSDLNPQHRMCKRRFSLRGRKRLQFAADAPHITRHKMTQDDTG